MKDHLMFLQQKKKKKEPVFKQKGCMSWYEEQLTKSNEAGLLWPSSG